MKRVDALTVGNNFDSFGASTLDALGAVPPDPAGTAASASSSSHSESGFASEPLIGLSWLWRLRWAAIAGQIAGLVVGRFVLDFEFPVLPQAVLLACATASNLVLARWLERKDLAHGIVAGVLFADASCLTLLLSWSGGAANPFSSFYVVYVTVAALVLGRDWAASLVAFTSLSFGALFWLPATHVGPHAHHVASPTHLFGMWLAYLISASFVAYFVSRIGAALRAREQQIRDLQRYAAATERVASLATMAAGAAHELGTPLGTIAIVATELASTLEQDSTTQTLAEDARCIREEVGRCRLIIDRLAAGAGTHSGEAPAWILLKAVVDDVLAGLTESERSRVRIQAEDLSDQAIRTPPSTLAQILGNLVRNALDATKQSDEPAAEVELAVAHSRGFCQFRVLDRGTGVSKLVAERLGEPFFTTKKPGEGMGLGVYLVRAFARQVRGDFQLEPRPGGGAIATLTLCVDPLEHERHVH